MKALLIALTACYVKRDDCNYTAYLKYFVIVSLSFPAIIALRVVPLVLESHFRLNPHPTIYSHITTGLFGDG